MRFLSVGSEVGVSRWFFMALLLGNTALLCAEDSKGTLSLALENDMFGSGTDKHYTHGTEISYVSDTYVPRWFRAFGSWLFVGDVNDQSRFSWALGQQMYTPDDLEQETLVEDDRPYAGWLYLSLGLTTEAMFEETRHVDSLELIFGVVGPKSGAEDAQIAVHDFIGAKEPQGWRHQLDDEYTIDLRYRRTWLLPIADNNADFLPAVGFTLGSSQRMVNVGGTLRVGSGLNSDFGAPLIRPSSSGSYYFKPNQDFYWYVFIGAHGRYVDYNVFLDGNRDGDSHSVDKRNWVADAQAGLVMGAGNWRVTLTNIYRTEEYYVQTEPDEFGSIGIAYRF